MRQVVRQLTHADEGLLGPAHVLICDRDSKWSPDVHRVLRDAGVRIVVTPIRAPNASAYAERFVRLIKEECLDRLIPSARPMFGAPSPNSSSIIIASGIIKVSGTP